MKRMRLNFRFSGMFGQTLLVLLVLTAVIGTFFGRFIKGIYEKQYLETQSALYFSNIGERSSQADQTVDFLAAKMESLLQSQDCSRLMVSGRELLQQPAMNMVQELASLAERDGDILNAWLSLPYSDKVLSSDKSMVKRADFPRQELLEAAGRFGVEGGVISQGQDCFLIMDYPEAKPLARLILRLNLPELYRKMGLAAEQMTGRGPIYVYDATGIPVFSDMISYPKKDSLMVSGLMKGENGNKIYRSDRGYLLVSQSERTGWYFIQRMEGISLAADTDGIRRALIMYGLLALALMVLASLYLIWRIYHPFRQVLETLVSQKNPELRARLGESSDNELELIRNIAVGDEEQKKRLKDILQSVGASLSEQLFSRLLSGGRRPGDEEEIRETMAQIDSPFPLDGRYRAAALQYWGKDHDTVSPVDEEIYGLQLARYSEHYWKSMALVQVIAMGEREKGLVLCMNASMTDHVWYRELERFEKSLRRHLAERGFEVAAGGSDSSGTLFDLNVLWAQAREELQQRILRLESETAERAGVQLPGNLLARKAEKQDGEGNKEKYDRVEQARQIIENSYGDSSLSLEQVSERLGVTAPYLSRIFAEYQPPGFLDCLNRYRIEQAKSLLVKTDDTAGEIGIQVGFGSHQSFIRVFKRYEGETPGQFRSRQRMEKSRRDGEPDRGRCSSGETEKEWEE